MLAIWWSRRLNSEPGILEKTSDPESSFLGMNTRAEEFPLDPASYPRPCHAVEGCEDVQPESRAIPASVAPMAIDMFFFLSFMLLTDHRIPLAATKTILLRQNIREFKD